MVVKIIIQCILIKSFLNLLVKSKFKYDKHKNLINLQDENGNTALHLAATNNNFNVVKQLINHGADVFLKNNDGKTPLHIACDYAHTNQISEIVSEILRNVSKEEMIERQKLILESMMENTSTESQILDWDI